VKVAPYKCLIVSAAYKCCKCFAETIVHLQDGILDEPTSCSAKVRIALHPAPRYTISTLPGTQPSHLTPHTSHLTHPSAVSFPSRLPSSLPLIGVSGARGNTRAAT